MYQELHFHSFGYEKICKALQLYFFFKEYIQKVFYPLKYGFLKSNSTLNNIVFSVSDVFFGKRKAFLHAI